MKLVAVAFLLAAFIVLNCHAAQKQVHLYGINYSPRIGADWAKVKCKSRDAIYNDMKKLKELTSRIRIYSFTDCNQGELVLSVCKELGLKVWAGMWVGTTRGSFDGELARLKQLIQMGLVGDQVMAIHVGSEAVYRGDVEPEQAIAYMKEVKEVLRQANLEMTVTISDISDTYLYHPSLTEAVDVVSANTFPFWENVPAREAVHHLIGKIQPLVGAAASLGKEYYITETGWSASGSNAAASDATPENQLIYFRDFYCTMHLKLGYKYFYFTSFDNTWRIQEDGDQNTVEGHFGIYYSNGNMKEHFKSFSFQCPGDDTVYVLPGTSVVEEEPADGNKGGNQDGNLDGNLDGPEPVDGNKNKDGSEDEKNDGTTPVEESDDENKKGAESNDENGSEPDEATNKSNNASAINDSKSVQDKPSSQSENSASTTVSICLLSIACPILALF